jgi:dephospho-CoA kinase
MKEKKLREILEKSNSFHDAIVMARKSDITAEDLKAYNSILEEKYYSENKEKFCRACLMTAEEFDIHTTMYEAHIDKVFLDLIGCSYGVHLQ